MIRKVFNFAAIFVLALKLFLIPFPDAAIAASPEDSHQGIEPPRSASSKSEAAEAWDAVKETKNPALLEAFIARYSTTFFADIAKARLNELKAATAKPPSAQQAPTFSPMPKDGVREQVVLYEEDPTDPKGRQFEGSVVWHTESIKADGKPNELAARADVDVPSRGLRMKMLLKRNLDPSLPASHVMELTLAVPANFNNGGVGNVPGVLMKSNQQARGTPLAGLAVKVTDGFFLVGLSAVEADRQRSLKLLRERSWFDIPIVYTNQRRAIIAIEKGSSGEQVFKTVLTTWGQYPEETQPETVMPDQSNRDMPEEWKRTMTGRPKAQ